jgi:hypothetical protein
MADHQLPRHSVDLPRQLAADLRRVAGRSGVPVSALVYSWLITASYFARHAPEVRLPSADRAPRGSLGGPDGTTTVKWSQSDPEYKRCADALERAGSSPTSVIRTLAGRYVACDGDPLSVDWGLPQRCA